MDPPAKFKFTDVYPRIFCPWRIHRKDLFEYGAADDVSLHILWTTVCGTEVVVFCMFIFSHFYLPFQGHTLRRSWWMIFEKSYFYLMSHSFSIFPFLLTVSTFFSFFSSLFSSQVNLVVFSLTSLSWGTFYESWLQFYRFAIHFAQWIEL